MQEPEEYEDDGLGKPCESSLSRLQLWHVSRRPLADDRALPDTGDGQQKRAPTRGAPTDPASLPGPAGIPRCSRACRLFADDRAVLHDQPHMPQGADVLRRITLHGNE